MEIFEIFQYSFMIRAFAVGLLVSLVAPVVGIFLVLRRFSLIADTLSHVSLAGIAVGFLTKTHPLTVALATTIFSSIIIEKLRSSKKISGESALALFLSGSLALAVIILGVSHGFDQSLFSYLFGSLSTVEQNDVWMIGILSLCILTTIGFIYRPLIYITFDEETATVSGIPAPIINLLFIFATALFITLAIPTVGVLLVSALLVIPVLTSLIFKKSFLKTIIFAQIISVVSVVLGIFLSYFFELPPGGTIVLVNIGIFLICRVLRD